MKIKQMSFRRRIIHPNSRILHSNKKQANYTVLRDVRMVVASEWRKINWEETRGIF